MKTTNYIQDNQMAKVAHRDLLPGDYIFRYSHLFLITAVSSYLDEEKKEVVRFDCDVVKDHPGNAHLTNQFDNSEFGAIGTHQATIIQRGLIN